MTFFNLNQQKHTDKKKQEAADMKMRRQDDGNAWLMNEQE